MKRVGFNALLLHPQAGGIAVYMKNLIDGMLHARADWQPQIFLRAEAMKEYGFSSSKYIVPVSFAGLCPVRRVLTEIFSWRRLLSQNCIDLLHVPISYFVPAVSVPTIITVHDLRILHFPDSYRPLRRAFLRRMIPWSARRAAQIIAVSQFTKDELVTRLGVDPDKVTVIHSGIESHRFSAQFSEKEKEQVRQTYRLPEQFILTVGHLEPRKNYERLIEAFALLRRRGAQYSLVIVGRENWLYQGIYDRVRRLGLSDAVHFTRFVEQADLILIYQMASLFVSPSIFEGFGFTPLEAMAAGIPVAVSNATSHPEVCGSAAEYFDPFNVKDMAEKMLRLIEDPRLAQSLVEEGRRNILRFSWERCCRETFQVYEECLKEL